MVIEETSTTLQSSQLNLSSLCCIGVTCCIFYHILKFFFWGPPKFFKYPSVYKKMAWAPQKLISTPQIISNNSSRVLVQYNFKLSKKLGPHPAPPASPNTLIKQNYSFLSHRHFQPSPNPKSKIPN